jgi:hypothetical protein
MAKLINPRICRFKLWNAVLAKKQASQKVPELFWLPRGKKFGQNSLTDIYESPR